MANIYIYITKEEYDAISFCSEEITSLVEGGAEDEYVKEADNALRSIASIQRKYRKALKRENALQDAKAAVKKLHPELKGEFYDKLVKNVVEQLINGGKMAKIKSTKKGVGKTVKLVGVQIDNDLFPYLKEQSNKSRFINNLLREHF